jgi:putative ABC transport system permease protein
MAFATHMVCRLLVRLYPASHRLCWRDDIEAAMRECIARERRRLGRSGTIYACLRLTADTVTAAVLLRIEEYRRRKLAMRRDPEGRAKETSMNILLQDVKYGIRMIRRSPIFSAVVISTLALAIGGTTAVFSVLDATLLRAVPFPAADRLVLVYQEIPGAIAFPVGFSPPDYLAFEERATVFESLAAFRNREYELSGIEPPERIIAVRASPSLFKVLGAAPSLGRTFTQQEDEGAAPVAVISDSLWTRKFGRDPAVLGRAVMLDRAAYTIVGVMPADFVFPLRGPQLNSVPADVYVPISFTQGERVSFGGMYNSSVVARLKPGVAPAGADAEAKGLVRSNASAMYPANLRNLAEAITASAIPFKEEAVGQTRPFLLIAFGAVAFVLLIACANIASLMLTRAAARGREIAVRIAVGARRSRIVRQLLVESALLAGAGGIVGVALAHLLNRTLVNIAVETLPSLANATPDERAYVFAAGVSALTAVLCGLMPALEASRTGTSDVLKDGGRGATMGRRQRRIFSALVTMQVAVAVVLLIGGGLLVRSLYRLTSVDPGFRGERVLTMITSLPAAGYATGADVRAFYTRMLERVGGLPGVDAVGASTDLPLSVRERRGFTIDNESAATRDLPHSVAAEWILGRYFEALGVPLKRGRVLSPQDTATSEPVVVINETMARTFFPGADPVGQRLAWGGPAVHGRWMRIVGVVGDVKQGPLNTDTVPQTYTPWLQVSDTFLGDNVVGQFRSLRLTIRTEMDPGAIAAAARQQIRALDPALPVTGVQTMDAIVRTSTAAPRFTATVIGGFALVALLIAAIGIAGVLATSISGRVQELGVRLAMGAQPAALVAMVVRQGMTLALLGLAIGAPAAWMASRVMSTMLFEISPRDPFTFAVVATLVSAVALLACTIPARRAARVEPLVALRRE